MRELKVGDKVKVDYRGRHESLHGVLMGTVIVVDAGDIRIETSADKLWFMRDGSAHHVPAKILWEEPKMLPQIWFDVANVSDDVKDRLIKKLISEGYSHPFGGPHGEAQVIETINYEGKMAINLWYDSTVFNPNSPGKTEVFEYLNDSQETPKKVIQHCDCPMSIHGIQHSNYCRIPGKLTDRELERKKLEDGLWGQKRVESYTRAEINAQHKLESDKYSEKSIAPRKAYRASQAVVQIHDEIISFGKALAAPSKDGILNAVRNAYLGIKAPSPDYHAAWGNKFNQFLRTLVPAGTNIRDFENCIVFTQDHNGFISNIEWRDR